MAVSPTVAKLAVKAAISVITDEESRNKVITLVLAPIAGVILLVSLIVYMVTMPFSMLGQFFTGSQYDNITNFRIEHGYDQNLSETDPSYLESLGGDFTDLTFESSSVDVTYYNQMDKRWSGMPYGTTTVGAGGCGPTSLAMVVSTFSTQKIDPPTMAKWAAKNGYQCPGSGSYHSLIPEGGRAFGLTVEGCTTKEPQKLIDALTHGKLVIGIFGKGTFTTSGHFLVMRGVTADGKILIADPASVRKSEQAWDLSIFLNEARKGAASGGPFWILSNPIS